MSYSTFYRSAHRGLAIASTIGCTLLASSAASASTASQRALPVEYDSVRAQDLLTTNSTFPSVFELAQPTQLAQANSTTEEAESTPKKLTIEVIPNVSTTGLGLSLAAPITNNLKARVGFNTFSLGIEAEADGIEYDGDLKLSSFSGGVDIYPFGSKSSFFIGAGLAIQNNRIEGTGNASSNQTFDINGTTYSAADVGTLNAEFEYPNDIAPYIGIGFGSPIASNSKFGFFANLGVMFAGKPNVSLTATGPLATDSQFASDLQAEIDRAEDDIDLPSIYPILSLGFSYRF